MGRIRRVFQALVDLLEEAPTFWSSVLLRLRKHWPDELVGQVVVVSAFVAVVVGVGVWLARR